MGMKPGNGGWWKRSRAVSAHDILWIPVSLFLAYWFRFNLGSIPSIHLSGLYWLMIVALPVQAGFFKLFGLYRGIWRFASIPDLTRILKSVAGGAALTFGLVFIFQRLEGVPRSVLLLYPMFLTMGLAAPRLLYRWWKDRSLHLASDRPRALVIGAGRAGELLLRDLLKSNVYLPIGILDDDPDKRGMEIHGIRVLGGLNDIPAQIRVMAVLRWPVCARWPLRICWDAIPSLWTRIVWHHCYGIVAYWLPEPAVPSAPSCAVRLAVWIRRNW